MQMISPRPNSLAQTVYVLLFSFPLFTSSTLTTAARSQLAALWLLNHPRMIQYLLDSSSRAHVSLQHLLNEIDARLTHYVWDPQIAIHDLVDTIEWVFLVDDGIKEDAESPHILLFAVVWLAGQDFRCCVI